MMKLTSLSTYRVLHTVQRLEGTVGAFHFHRVVTKSNSGYPVSLTGGHVSLAAVSDFIKIHFTVL